MNNNIDEAETGEDIQVDQGAQREKEMVRSLMAAGFPAYVGKRSFTSASLGSGTAVDNLVGRLRDDGWASRFVAEGQCMEFAGISNAERAFWFAARSLVARGVTVRAFSAPALVRSLARGDDDMELWERIESAQVLALWGVTNSSPDVDAAWSGAEREEFEMFVRSMFRRGKAVLLCGAINSKKSPRFSDELNLRIAERTTFTPTIS